MVPLKTYREDDFMTALKKGITWLFEFERNDLSRRMLQNFLNGTTAVMAPELCRTRERTIYNLRDRYLAEKSTKNRGSLKVDECLPGLSLQWEHEALKINAVSKRDSESYSRNFRFSVFPAEYIEELAGERVETGVSSADTQEYVEITAEAFAALDKDVQSQHYAFQPDAFEYPEQPVPVNAYFLGLWNGVGDRRSTTNANDYEQEIRQFLSSHATELEQTMPAQRSSGVDALLKEMDHIGLMYKGVGSQDDDTRHIPECYMKNTREVRLAVLAGLVDSDDYYKQQHGSSGALVFTQSDRSHTRLFQDTVKLARSLGFQVSVTNLNNAGQEENIERLCTVGNGLVAVIRGNLSEIPTILHRKIALESSAAPLTNHLIQSIELEEEETEWFGFRVDVDQLYLRHDHLVLHNSGFEESMRFKKLTVCLTLCLSLPSVDIPQELL